MMNTKANLLKTLIREEIKRQLRSQRLNEAETPEESLMTSFKIASDSSQMDFIKKLNTIAKVLKPTGYLNGTVVKMKGNEIIVVVPLPKGMIDIPEMEELHDMGVVSYWGSPTVLVLDKYKFEIHNPSGGFYGLKDGVSLLQLIKLLKNLPSSDSDAVQELVLYAENDSKLYNVLHKTYVPALNKFIAKGNFDEMKALKLLEYYLTNYVRPAYKREFGDDIKLNPADRKAFAKEILDSLKSEGYISY